MPRDITANNLGHEKIVLKKGQTISAEDGAIFHSIDTLRTFLLTKGYTAAKLNAMTKNDLIFAARKKLTSPLV